MGTEAPPNACDSEGMSQGIATLGSTVHVEPIYCDPGGGFDCHPTGNERGAGHGRLGFLS